MYFSRYFSDLRFDLFADNSLLTLVAIGFMRCSLIRLKMQKKIF